MYCFFFSPHFFKIQLSNDTWALHFKLVLNVVEFGVAAELHRDKTNVVRCPEEIIARQTK